MVNNQEFFCSYCKKKTLFFLESDFVWYCDECDNPLDDSVEEITEDTIDFDEMDWVEEFENSDFEKGEKIVRCPYCEEVIAVNELVENNLCPFCLERIAENMLIEDVFGEEGE